MDKSSEGYIVFNNVSYMYPKNVDEDTGIDKEINIDMAVDHVDFRIKKGDFICIIGKNGSGKSTMAKLMNSLLIPSEGICYINSMDTRDEKFHWEIHKSCGMVFQNPDNQIIGTTVEEDIAFGLENLGVKHDEMVERINNSLKYTNIEECRERAPHQLSGGQKQRLAIAGILAMEPECIVFDEATAMLDPVGRKDVMDTIKKLNKEKGLTIVHITHHMDETIEADHIFVVEDGKIIMSDVPKKLFANVEKINAAGLEVPQITELFYELRKEGYNLPDDVLTINEGLLAVSELINSKKRLTE